MAIPSFRTMGGCSARICLVAGVLSLPGSLACTGDDAAATTNPGDGTGTTGTSSMTGTGTPTATGSSGDETGASTWGPYCALPVLDEPPAPKLDVPWPDECSFWTEDCPPGEKCSIWSSIAACAPIDPSPGAAGDSCTTFECGDDCDALTSCYDERCVSVCGGSPEAPICPDGSTCIAVDHTAGSNEPVPLCLTTCDPLGEGCIDPLSPCVLSDFGPGFACLPPDTPQAGLDDTCNPGAWGTVCPPGWHCTDVGSYECRELCEIGGEPCPLPELECTSVFEAPELAMLGVCL